MKKIEQIVFLLLLLFLSLTITVFPEPQDSLKECPKNKPIFKKSIKECILEGCTEEDFTKEICQVTNPVIKQKLIRDFLYVNEPLSPIYSSLGKYYKGDIYF